MPRRRKQATKSNAPQGDPPSPPTSVPSIEQPEQTERPPFFNTTFSTHRVSPLYLGAAPLTSTRLQVLSQRLRDTLVGDVVRGVQVGLEGEDTSLGRAGPLERVAIRWFAVEDLLGGNGGARPPSPDLSSDAIFMEEEEGAEKKMGLWIEMRYENALCIALLLPMLEKQKDKSTTSWAGFGQTAQSAHEGQFIHLPLLLLRMPAPLKAVIADFLSNTFDCRVSLLHLGTKSLIRSWERWIKDAGLPSRGVLAKDMMITLGFHIPSEDIIETATEAQSHEKREDLGIKSIDVIIPAPELHRFHRAGEGIEDENILAPRPEHRKRDRDHDAEGGRKRRRLAGGRTDEGWGWRREDAATDDGQPFTEALARYIEDHLALDMFHPGVRIIKIACSGFVMSDGRVKVFAPPTEEDMIAQPVWKLMARLVDRARGPAIEGSFQLEPTL